MVVQIAMVIGEEILSDHPLWYLGGQRRTAEMEMMG